MNPFAIIVWLVLAFYAGLVLFMIYAAATGPLKLGYNLRNVFVRWRATLAAVLGIALVVSVFVLVQALAAGIEKSGANTGDPRNLIVVRKGSTAESSSLISRDQVKTLEYAPEVARNERGQSLFSADVLVIMNLPRKGTNVGEANVLLRGISPRGPELRPQVTLVAGRWFEPGKREVVVSRRLADRFAHFDIGESFKTGPAVLTVVGWIDGQNSAFDSETWMDVEECRRIFDRDMYSSLLVRPMDDLLARTNLVKRIEGDKRLQLRTMSELDYYKAQTKTAVPIRWMGNFLARFMSIGAIFAAMNTMYAALGARTREVGTLRVLGFRRRTVVLSFLIEGVLLAVVGGALGIGVAFLLNGTTVSWFGFETFSEIVFEFAITPALMLKGLQFAVAVGLAGTFLPALRAARLPVITALKSV